jgi:indolepyruvate ferredoxin oxidoreductase beta subunit
MPVIIGAAEYPVDVLDELTAKGVDVDALDALSLAQQAGSAKAVNIVLMGKAAKQFDIPYDRWIKAIENTVKEKFVEMNKKAFDLGYNS